jgi:hypothetical protein
MVSRLGEAERLGRSQDRMSFIYLERTAAAHFHQFIERARPPAAAISPKLSPQMRRRGGCAQTSSDQSRPPALSDDLFATGSSANVACHTALPCAH